MGNRRPAIKPAEKLKVWVRAGGRCAICNRYLLEDGLVGREVTVGEMAHIIGQSATPGSPRGLYDRPEDERNDADNLVLICPNDHTAVDLKQLADVMTVERVLDIKLMHERRIRHATDLVAGTDTVVLRIVGDVFGTQVELTREITAAAVLKTGSRFPTYDLAFDRHSLELDLRRLPGSGTSEYFSTACRMIDQLIDGQVRDGIVTNRIQHLSVFGFARLPLLVYLGAKLDDGIGVEIFQRQRTTDAWEWLPGDGPKFETIEHQARRGASDVAVVISISGAVDLQELPAAVADAAVYEIRAVSTPLDTTRFRTREEFRNFADEYRSLLGRIEEHHKTTAKFIHLFAAAPISAAIEMGRSRDPNSQPPVVVYQRDSQATGERYTPAVTIK